MFFFFFKQKAAYEVLFGFVGSEICLRDSLGVGWVTLITAFGIALVKADLVIQDFMHLRWEKRLVKWVLISSLVLMALFVAGVAPDVMRHEGQNWVNVAAADAVDRGIEDEHAEEGTAATVADADAFDVVGQFNLICSTCHGSAGDGNGAAGAAPARRPPASLPPQRPSPHLRIPPSPAPRTRRPPSVAPRHASVGPAQ